MFKRNTVLVVGAGASRELKFPLGAELATTITQNLKEVRAGDYIGTRLSDRQADNLVRKRGGLVTDLIAAGRIITTGAQHAVSIDAFIDTHRDKPMVGELGKLQIALEISRAEARSDLFVSPDNIYNRVDFAKVDLSRSWLKPFAKILLDGCRATHLSDIGDGLTIVCFNYDRCIEQYLVAAISDAMDIDEERAHSVVSGMNIIHPYGSLGPLPNTSGTVQGAERFGSLDRPWEAVQRIRTYTEELKEQETLVQIRSAVSRAAQMVFLGFSFAPQNMRLLEPTQLQRAFDEKKFFTTGVGIDPVADDEIKGRMLRLAGSSATYSKAHILRDMTCEKAMVALAPILADPSPNLDR